MTKCEIVKEIDKNKPNRAKTNTRPRKFRKVLKLIESSSTSMNSNDKIYNHNQNTRSRSITERII